MTDVDAEHSLSGVLPDLIPDELAMFQLDIIINERGIHCDRTAIENLIKKIDQDEADLLAELQMLTGGAITSTKQTEQCRQWLWRQGLQLNDLQKFTLIEALKIQELPQKLRRVVEIRQALSMTSVAKMNKMRAWSCEDGRIRGTMMYHGAGTGRWAGKGIQPQNFPREAYDDMGVEAILHADVEMVRMMEGSVNAAASQCLRGMLCAPDGQSLVCADYSAIEARVVAWLAHEQHVIDTFVTGKDIYKVAAEKIYNVPYDQVTKDQRKIGKVCVLALGYQGWLGAFDAMAGVYGVKVPDEQAKEIILAWRDGHPNIVNLWQGLMDAAIATVQSGQPHSYGYIKFYIEGPWLRMRLPSGRSLSYYGPEVVTEADRFNRMRTTVKFWGMKTGENSSKVWQRLTLYGGLLTENATQAVARDVLADGIKRVDPIYPVIMHVHDEAVSQLNHVPSETQAKEIVEHYENLLATNPTWAQGLPLAAEGWVGKRYRK